MKQLTKQIEKYVKRAMDAAKKGMHPITQKVTKQTKQALRYYINLLRQSSSVPIKPHA